MKAFNSLDEMVSEYLVKFNNGLDEAKQFSADDAKEFIVKTALRVNLKAQYKVEISAKFTKAIDGFGYVAA